MKYWLKHMNWIKYIDTRGVFRRSGINDNNESLNLFEIICVI